jgi:2,4-dienoyl-CoA reductase-like NADH-dependent reductase (Old Yellow Enzyme family)
MLDSLFRAFNHKSLSLNNRVVMAPMTRRKSPDGTPTEDVAAYYKLRAEGGVGLIITEGTTIDRDAASGDANIPNFHDAKSLDGWRRVVNGVHAAGGKIAPQLWHEGMTRKVGTGPRPDSRSEGPSGLSALGEQVVEPMSDSDIADTIDAFAKAALAAKQIGFDAVELHGAHGYLIDQFVWQQSNRRIDGYGGGLADRTRFAAEIVREIRRRVGPHFVVIHRFSQWKSQDYSARIAQSPDELAIFLGALVDAGVDIFHCSTRRFWEPEFEGSSLNLAGWTKKLGGKPAIAVGSVGLKGDFLKSFKGETSEIELETFTELNKRLSENEFDLVAVGRALLTDPSWANKMREGRYSETSPFYPGAMKSLA